MARVCGIGITGKSAIFILLNGDKNKFVIEKIDTKKINLEDDLGQESVITFSKKVHKIFIDHNIKDVYIKRPSTSGRFQASPTAFKIETIIQLEFLQVNLVAPQTIAALLKKDNRMEEAKDQVLKYQIPALEAAFYGLK